MSESKVRTSNDQSKTPADAERTEELDQALAAGIEGETGEDRSSLKEGTTERLEGELQQAQARALRAHADLENYRKRMRREMAEERKYSQLPLLRDLLPVLDHLDLAIEAMPDTDDAAGLSQGVRMVADQLKAVLEDHHCRRIDPVGKQFDPNLHEAVGQEASDEVPGGSVIRVAKAGYLLHDRVVRPSQVVVSTGTTGQSNASGSKDADADSLGAGDRGRDDLDPEK